MIVSNINSPELELYAKMNERFAMAFDTVKKIFSEGIEDGKHSIKADELYVNVMTYVPKSAELSCFEAHKKYVDIQVILEGEEIIGFESAEELEITKEYAAEGDCMLYAMNDRYDSVRVKAGEFAIIFPEEPHAPGIAASAAPTKVRKAVVKVLWN